MRYLISVLLIFSISASFAQSGIQGTVYYQNDTASLLGGVTIYLKNQGGTLIDSTSTTNAGTYQFQNLSPGVYGLSVKCPLNWGGGNALDALLIMKHFTGLEMLYDNYLDVADVNASLSVNSLDAMLVMKRFTGIANSFISGDWYFKPDTVTILSSGNVFKDFYGLCFGDVNGSFIPPVAQPVCPSVVYGGHTYAAVQIGTQCWMKENLNIGTMVTDNSTGVQHSHCSNNGIIEKYCYNNDTAMCNTWGGLYDWNEMMNYVTTPGAQGICPSGWHIPTDAEYCTLSTYLDAGVSCSASGYSGSIAAAKMKETGTAHWSAPNQGATNESGFTALAAGYRFPTGYTNSLNQGIYLWTSTEYPSNQHYTRNLSFLNANISRYHYITYYGFSVRCLKN